MEPVTTLVPLMSRVPPVARLMLEKRERLLVPPGAEGAVVDLGDAGVVVGNVAERQDARAVLDESGEARQFCTEGADDGGALHRDRRSAAPKVIAPLRTRLFEETPLMIRLLVARVTGL